MSLTPAEKRICSLMYELRDDLYREVRPVDAAERRADIVAPGHDSATRYAMVNPPGNVRVEFWQHPDSDERVCAVLEVVRGEQLVRSAVTDDADASWLDEVP